MKNCLKEQLKAEVSNESLPVYNQLSFSVSPYDGTGFVKLANDNGLSVTVENGTPASYSGNVVNATITATDSSKPIVLKVLGKYGLERLSVETGNINTINLDDCKYFNEDSETIYLPALSGNTTCVGNLSSFSGITNLHTLNLRNMRAITGSIMDLTGLTSLTSVKLANCIDLDAGKLEDFVEEQAISRTSGTLQIELAGTSIIFKRSSIAIQYKIVYGNDVVTVNDTNDVLAATYTKATGIWTNENGEEYNP